jgi:hypothetical protein
VAGTPDLLFDTERFNLSAPQPHFINPSCFGEDLAGWLRERLVARSIPTTEPDQEDWGWYIEAAMGEATYLLGIGGNADETGGRPNLGEWRVMVQKHRTLWQKLTGGSPPGADDPMAAIVEEILRAEPDFRNIRRD